VRQKIIDEAYSWIGTPWHHRACVKGAGVDCVFLLAGVYTAVGLINVNRHDIPYYPIDIMQHRSEETVLAVLTRYAHEVKTPKMGDVALWRFGRIYSHAGIIIDHPNIIHAYRVAGAVVAGDITQGDLAGRQVKYFSFFDEDSK
jgi:cell wall-associated NlpC family hydrolase